MKWIVLSIMALGAFIMGFDIAASGGKPPIYLAATVFPPLGIYAMAWPLGWKGAFRCEWRLVFARRSLEFRVC